MELRGAVLLLLLFTDTSFSAGASCKTFCTDRVNSALKPKPGTTYLYNLEGHTQTSVPKTSNADTATLNLHAKVEVSYQQECAALIKLKSVEVTGPGSKKYSSLAKLEANPLKVNLDHGVLGADVCAVPEDDYTSLNIKRAVASLLQISTTETSTVPETDVFGACSTNYNVRKEGDVTTVLKQRDLNKCAYREAVRQDIFAIPQSGSSSLPLLEPTYDAEIKVADGVVQSAVVKESYLLRPFSDRDNGARTKITTTLTLESKTESSIADTTVESRSVIFENPHETVESTISTVLSALHKVVDGSENAVGDGVARNFADLVHLMRHASAEDLLSVYGQVKAGAGFKNQKQLAKKTFADALFRAGSGDSVAVAVELLKSNEIDKEHSQLWYLSFAFVRHASSKSLEKAASLLDGERLPREGYLGIGALAGRFCREHPCDNNPAFNNLLRKLAKLLSNPVPTTRVDENRLVGSLKTLGNVKKLNPEVSALVANVVKEHKAPTRVRAAALDTIQSYPCCEKLRKAAADVLLNKEEDSELRIKAYLALVECPQNADANKLSELLQTETVNQVGAFITSHLRNLRASANPDRQAARKIFQNVRPSKKYPIDIRKYSQNYEFSYDIDSLSSAASFESNVIFSQKSYLPRSVNLNLTAEVFGHAFNLVEVTARAENLERVIEKYLGPKGYITNTKLETLVRDGNSEVQSLKQLLEEKYKRLTRVKRSVDARSKSQAFGKKVKLYPSELDSNIDFDLSLRLLGNELFWTNLGEKNLAKAEAVIDKVSHILEKGFGQAKDFDHNIQNHALFLDTELAYPTAIGLPVKLTATGTSVVHLKAAGSLDFGALLKDPNNGQFKFEIRPSASVEVTGQLSVDGYAVETGVKLSGQLHTATGSEVSIKLLDGHGVDVHVGLPVKQSDLLTVTTEVLTVFRERGQHTVNKLVDFQIPRKDFQGCFDQLQPIIGLTLCGKVGFPNDAQPLISGAALYPLNGHSKVSIRLDKEDESLTSYHFKAYYDIKDPEHRKVEFLVETPGSKNPREISFLAEAKTQPHKEINVKLVTPIYKIRAEGKIIDTDKEFSLSGLVNLDGQIDYRAKVGLLINGQMYTPVLEVLHDKKSIFDLKVEGSVQVEKTPGSPRKKYTFNNVRVGSGQVAGQYSVDGTVITDTNLYQSDLKLGYGDSHTITFKEKIQRQGDNNLKINAEVRSSQQPDLSFALKYEYQLDNQHLENSLVIVHGSDLNSKEAKISIFQQVNYKIVSVNQFDVSTKNTASYPLLGFDAKFEGSATQKSLTYDLYGTINKNQVSSKLSAKRGDRLYDYEIDFQVNGFGRGLRIELDHKLSDKKSSKLNNVLVLTPGGKYELNADVKHVIERGNLDVDLSTKFTAPNVAKPYEFKIGLLTNPSHCHAHVQIVSSGNNILHAYVKQHRDDAQISSGEFKFDIKNAIESSGQYKKTADKANGDFIILLIPLGRKIKGNADLTVSGPKYLGTIAILYDADKDASKKLLINTDTDLTSRSIQSKNKLSLNGKELLVNFNGEAKGKPGNGALNGGYDITLPSGEHFVARLENSVHLKPQQSSGEIFVDVGYSLQKGTPLTKLTLTAHANNVDLRHYTFDTKLDAKLTCPESGDITLVQSLKSSVHDHKWHVDAQSALGGSRLGDYQFNGKTKATLSKTEISQHSTANFGEKASFDWETKIATGIEDKIRILENTFKGKVNDKSGRAINKIRVVEGEGDKPCQFTTLEELIINDIGIILTTEGAVSTKEGHIKYRLESPGMDKILDVNVKPRPVTGDLKYKHYHAANDLRKGEISLTADLGGNTAIDTELKANYNKDLSVLNTQFNWLSKLNQEKKVSLAVNYKRVSTVSHVGEVKLSYDNNKYDLTGKIDTTAHRPNIDLSAVINGALNRYYLKVDRKSERHATAESIVVWSSNGGGKMESFVSSDFESPENFAFVFKINNEKYGMNKIKFELANKPNKAGSANRVTFSAQNGDKQGISGSGSYVYKEHENGFTVEGKGTASVNGENHPLTYKISLTNKGFILRTFKMNIDFTKGSFLIDSNYSPNDSSSHVKACFEKNCLDYHVKSLAQYQDLLETKRESLFKYRNTLGNRNDHIEITHKTERKGTTYFDSLTTVGIQKFSGQLHSYADLKNAGIVLTLPSRELAAVAAYELPSLKKDQPQILRLEASLFPDRKKAPELKSTLHVEGKVEAKNHEVSLNGHAKFTNPKLPRDLSLAVDGAVGTGKTLLRGKVDVDVLAKKNQAFTLAVEFVHDIVNNGHNVTGKSTLISKGLTVDVGGSGHIYASPSGASFGSFLYYVDDKNIKKDAGVLFEATKERLVALVKAPGRELVNGFGKIGLGKDVKTVDLQLTLAEGETGILNVKLTGLRELSTCLHTKSNPSRMLTSLISLSNEKLEGKLERIENDKHEILAKAILRLDQGNLFKVDYDIQAENIKKTVDNIQKIGKDINNRFKNIIQQLIEEISKELKILVDLLKKARPDFNPLINAYKESLEKLIKELESDPTLSHLSALISNSLRVPYEIISQLQKLVNDLFKTGESILHTLHEIQKKLEPDLKKAIETLIRSYNEISHKFTDFVMAVVQKAVDVLKKHEDDIKLIMNNIADSFQEIGQAGLKTFNQLRQELQDLINLLVDQLKNLPIVTETQDRIKELLNQELPPHFWELYQELVATTQDFLPTQELKDFAKSLFAYVEKLLRNQKVDNTVELQQLSTQAAAILNSAFKKLDQIIGADRNIALLGINLRVPPSAATVLKLPELGSIKFSPFSLLTRLGDWPTLSELIQAYRPNLNPLVPPFTVYGVIMSSHHFITFDKRHYAFKGSCSYILAQDFLDGNFSIIANLENGKMKSVAISDASNIAEIHPDGMVTVNGKHGDFPFKQGEISGWRRYASSNIRHAAGVQVTYYLPTDIYIIRVSNFYFGRTRGLLGTISNEQYDEYQLPNGKIADNSEDNANAYKLNEACADVPKAMHSDTHSPDCTALFTSDSSLRYYFNILSPEPFREACDQHVNMLPNDAKRAACDVAVAYVGALINEGAFFAQLPAQCAQCTINGKKVELGHSEQVKASNKADIVLVLEQSSYNEVVFRELITPLISTLTTDLKEKGITDTEFSLIGYGSAGQKWPQHFTNNGKITYTGKADRLVFSDPEKLQPPYDTVWKKLNLVKRFVDIELGLEQIVTAMTEANRYPFREGAVRSIVLINSTPCSSGPLFPLSLQVPRTLSIYKYYQDNALNFYIITPLKGLAHNKPELNPKSIVGFDSKRVYYLSDAKKKEAVGETEHRSELSYEDDLCLTFSQIYGNAAFSSQNFIDSKPDQRKKFVEVLSQRIVKDTANKVIANDCTCTLINGLLPYAQCTSSER